MATRRSYLTRPSYVYLAGEKSSSNNEEITDDIGLEFDESEVWNSGQVPSSDPFKKPIPSSRASKKPVSKKMGSVTATSLPVNIPDWSKILRDDYRLSQRKESDEDKFHPQKPYFDCASTISTVLELLDNHIGDNITAPIAITEPYMRFSLHTAPRGPIINLGTGSVLFIYLDIFVG
ncbi:unnamed protein product, partial [Vitis vinifera]